MALRVDTLSSSRAPSSDLNRVTLLKINWRIFFFLHLKYLRSVSPLIWTELSVWSDYRPVVLTLSNVDPGSVTSVLESLLHPSCKQHVITVVWISWFTQNEWRSEELPVHVLRHMLISMQIPVVNLVLLRLSTLFLASWLFLMVNEVIKICNSMLEWCERFDCKLSRAQLNSGLKTMETNQ